MPFVLRLSTQRSTNSAMKNRRRTLATPQERHEGNGVCDDLRYNVEQQLTRPDDLRQRPFLVVNQFAVPLSATALT